MLVIVTTLILLTILQACTTNNNNKTTFDKIEYLKQKSVAVSLAMYTGSENILNDNATGEAKEKLIDIMKLISKQKVLVENIDISTSYEDDGRITIITSIEEKPFKSILFHEFTYEYIDGKWLIVSFGQDA